MQRRFIFLFALIAICFFQVQQIQAQVLRSNVNFTDPSPFPDAAGRSFFDEFRLFDPNFTSPSFLRLEIHGGLQVANFATIDGPVIAYDGAFFDQLGGSTRSLELASDFSAAFIFDGTVEAFNPGTGFNLIDIAGGSVAFGNYNARGTRVDETTEQWQQRVSALDTPTNAGIFVSGGTVKAGIASGVNGDLSLGADGLLDVSGGRVEASFGDIAGRFNISGGVFPNLAVNSLSGEINILGDNLQHEGTTVDSNGLQVETAGGQITGTLTDGSAFSFTVPDILGDGSVNLFTNNSEVNITPENTSGLVNGGSDFSGGVEVSFDEVEVEGDFTSNAQVTEIGALAEAVGASVDPDFELASEETAQHWELDFTGDFVNEGDAGAELVFGYDELAIDVEEEDLAIFHFDELTGEWEELQIIEHDLDRNSIRVRTSSFSPFVLGAATTAVPEPSSAVVLMALMLSAAFRRRS